MQLVSIIQDPKYKHLFSGDNEIPTALRFGSRLLPLDRYVQTVIGNAQLVDWEERLSRFIVEQQKTLKKACLSLPDSASPLVDFLLNESKQKNRQLTARQKIFNNRNGI